MGGDLAERVGKRHVLAVLGFECGARTSPFLGLKGTNEENIALQAAIAPDAPWLGMLAWGEIAPVGGEPAFHNYTYPLVVLTAG
jgi:small ligand-binding sensory domain FIST